MGRRTSLIAAALFVLAAGGVAYSYFAGANGDELHGYVTEAIERGLIERIVTATGTLNPVTTVQVGTYVSGPIQAIDVDFNSPVKKGQRVAKIDARAFQVKVKQAEANLANARAKVEKDRADLQLKKLTLDRNRELLANRLIAQNDLDTAESNYHQARAQLALDEAGVKQADAALQEAQINLAYTDIVSPVDGVVVSRNVDVGQTVAASFQTPTLFLIAQDLTKMQVDAAVSESDIGEAREGQDATFSVDAYPGKVFAGRVAQVRNAPTTVQNVVTYDVVIAVDNADLALKPGMTATVAIVTVRRENVPRIPLRALRFNPDRKPSTTPEAGMAAAVPKGPPAVWVLQADGQVRKAELAVGVQNDQYAELLSGPVQPGDQLAVALRRSAKRGDEQQSSPWFMGRRFR
jgi:HlyD family secretion protein